MILEVLIGSIAKNTESIEAIAKNIRIKSILIGVGLYAIVKTIKHQNNRINTIEEELSELSMKGE